MKLYHGSDIAGIDILIPASCDQKGKRVLYLTDNWAYSLFYLRDRKIDFVTCGIGPDGKVHYDEKFPNQLKILYQGKSGYIYEVETDAVTTRTPGIWISAAKAKVSGYACISDAYMEIRKEIDNGTIDFLSYDDLSIEQRRLNHEGAVRYLVSGKVKSAEKTAFYREYFPEAWMEAQNILAQRK